MAHVLLVDDDPDERGVLKELLEDDGIEVHEAKDGQQALELLLSEDRPGIVVLDLEMPRLSGRQLLEIMASYVRLSRIPVIILSGHERTELHYDAIAASFAKPGDVDELRRVVRAAIAAAIV